MVSRIFSMYKVLAATFTNGYRDGVWRITPIIPKNIAITEHQKKPNSLVRILPRGLVKHTKGSFSRLHRRDGMRQGPKREHQVVTMASKTGYIQATRSMAKPLVRVDQLGIVPRWKKEALLGAEVFIKADPLEMTVYKKIYEAGKLVEKDFLHGNLGLSIY